MSRIVVIGLFDAVGKAAAAEKSLRVLSVPEGDITTISSVPLPEGAVGCDPRPVRFPLFVAVAWFVGAGAGLFLAVYTYVTYPLITAGKAIISVPPAIIITYEVAMLFAILATLVFGFREMGLPRFRRRKVHDPRIHEGKIAVMAAVERGEQEGKALEALAAAGGTDVRAEEGEP